MTKRSVVKTDSAPKAIGPYSQAIQSDSLVFCSGQIPLDPSTGKLVSEEINSQTEQVLNNLGEVLKASGSCFNLVVKTTIFLTDLKDFATVNEIYGRYFPENPPARSTIQVAALPLGSRVEIEAIALFSR